MAEIQEVENASKDHSLRNIILLSLSFMLIFTALVTTGNISQIILKTKQKEDPNFTGDGYISLSIVYSVFALANFLSPSLVAVLKAKRTLILCSCFYILFIINFIFTTTWSLYLVSVLLGLAAAGLWTAQGNYLTINSTKDTITRNTGVFWVFLCCSQFIGNGIVFWQFFGKTHIDAETRTIVLTFLACIGSCGVICFLCLGDTRQNSRNRNASSSPEEPVAAFVNSMKLLKDRNMQLLILTFIFLGTNQSFFTGIYPTSIGFTKQLGTISKSLVGLSGICTGVGGLIGGSLVMVFGPRVTTQAGRFPIASIGCVFLTTAYILVYLNIPTGAPLGPTDSVATLDPPSPVIAMLCSFFLGFGDSFLHTQIYGTLSTIWPLKSSQAFATLHFFKSVAVAFQFFNSTRMGITGQLIMLQSICVISCIAFLFVDRSMRTKMLKLDIDPVIEKGNEQNGILLETLNKT